MARKKKTTRNKKQKRRFDELSPKEQEIVRKKREEKRKQEAERQKEIQRKEILKKRKKIRRKKRIKRLFAPKRIALFLLAAALISGLVFLLRSPMFNIKNIEVQGQHIASKESIIEKSKLQTGKNMFSFNSSSSQGSIEEIIFVKKARITRKYPDTIIINIEERTPAYILESDKNYYDIDSDGVVLLKSDTILRYDVPLVSGINLKKVKVGNHIYEGKDIKLQTINNVFDWLLENELMSEVSQFYAHKNGNYYLYLKKGSILEFSNYNAFKSHSDFIKYFFKNEDAKVKVELIEDINPIYKKVK